MKRISGGNAGRLRPEPCGPAQRYGERPADGNEQQSVALQQADTAEGKRRLKGERPESGRLV
ncbi:MAG: hypothetical protein ACOC2L_03290 [Candidatus Sumerlaeota bacterium]